jgi:hypothetical protein
MGISAGNNVQSHIMQVNSGLPHNVDEPYKSRPHMTSQVCSPHIIVKCTTHEERDNELNMIWGQHGNSNLERKCHTTNPLRSHTICFTVIFIQNTDMQNNKILFHPQEVLYLLGSEYKLHIILAFLSWKLAKKKSTDISIYIKL